MRTFKCPKCGLIQIALGSLVAHRCTMNKNRMTQMEVVDEAQPDKPSK